MNEQWFSRVDWPLDHEKKRRTELMSAVASIPRGEFLSEVDIEGKALLIFSTANWSRQEELPRNLNASRSATDAELTKLHDLCKRLSDHIDTLHEPAVSALFEEGLAIMELSSLVKEAQETARFAYGHQAGENTVTGRPKKIVAADVTGVAASIWTEIAGRAPTYTTNPMNGTITGDWPDTLQRVFKALWIDASVPAQVKALREKSLY